MKINHKIVAEHLGVKLRGNETFTELLEIEKQVKEKIKTIKIYVEGGVVTDVTIPEEFHNKINYEVIDYDHIEAEREERIAEEKANIQRVDAQVKGVKKW